MNVNLIFFLLIIFLAKINNNDDTGIENIIKFELSNNKTKIKKQSSFTFDNKTINISEFLISTYINDSILNCSLFNIIEEIKGDSINYFNIRYKEDNDNKRLYTELFNENITFKLVNISYNLLSQTNYSILSMNNFNDKLIFFDYIHKNLIIDYNFSNINDIAEEAKNILKKENLCFNESINNEDKRKFICKLDYILLGHGDLPKDDVYLAKQIDEGLSTAYLDNMISYSIFPYEYLDYFFTSFFSELNDGCKKNSYKTDVEGKQGVMFYYITCPRKKIDIYTKRRKLSIIINKFSYRIENLFVDSFDFLSNSDTDTDIYYFNILFQKDRTNFVLGFGFISKIMFLNYNHSTYIYSNERIDYTEDLTDDSSEYFEKWLYILTACSFFFLLLIFTIIGCFHLKRTKSELKEMLKSHIK